jgi:WD40 repeat protein
VGPWASSDVIPSAESVSRVGFSPDNRRFFYDSLDENLITLYDARSNTILEKFSGRNWVFSPDGKSIAHIRDTNIILRDSVTLRERSVIPLGSPLLRSLAFSSNSRFLALRQSGDAVIIDVKARRQVATLPAALHNSDGPLLFSPDSKTLIEAGGTNGTIRFWNASSWKLTTSLFCSPEKVTSLALSPDGRLLAGSIGDTRILLWDLEGGRAASNPVLQGNSGRITSLSFSPDGRTLASGTFDGPIKLWNVASGQELGTLQGHFTGVYNLAFSPDGQSLISSSYDATIRIWHGRK